MACPDVHRAPVLSTDTKEYGADMNGGYRPRSSRAQGYKDCAEALNEFGYGPIDGQQLKELHTVLYRGGGCFVEEHFAGGMSVKYTVRAVQTNSSVAVKGWAQTSVRAALPRRVCVARTRATPFASQSPLNARPGGEEGDGRGREGAAPPRLGSLTIPARSGWRQSGGSADSSKTRAHSRLRN